MAAVGEYFSIGSTVACKTCFDQTVEGEVLAFDPQTKMLILKTASKNSDRLHDVYVINLGFCSDVHVKNEVSSITEAPQPLNLGRLKTRYRNSVEERHRWLQALAAGVSQEGQNLYMAVSKKLNKVTWSGQNIVVFDEVTISPPYTLDNITTINPEKTNSLVYVKKMVEQFLKGQQQQQTASAIQINNSNSATGIVPVGLQQQQTGPVTPAGGSSSSSSNSSSTNKTSPSGSVGPQQANSPVSPVPAN